MKRLFETLFALIGVLVVVNVIRENYWLQVALVSIVVVTFIMVLVTLGVWIGSKNTKENIMLGADIVLRGQEINDKWDAAKFQALGQFGREIIKVKGDAIETGRLPNALPSGFIVEGLIPKQIESNVESEQDQ